MNKISQLVDHQVFQQIQSTPSDHPIGKGTVIFANSFTGTPVEMDQRVRDVLTSESLFIGNNPIVQLQKALERLERGPWYIDCRGEVLYIHNKPYQVPSVHKYVYAHENGEVLSISFKTSYRTKNAQRGSTMSFDAFNKNINATSTGISVGSEMDLAEQAKQASGPQLQESPSPNYLSPDIDSERGYWSTHYKFPEENPKDVQAKEDKNFQDYYQEDLKTFIDKSETVTNMVQNLFQNKNMSPGSPKEKSFKEDLKGAGDNPVKREGVFRNWFGQDTVTVDLGTYRPVLENRTLKSLIGSHAYIPAYNSKGKPIGSSYVFNNGVVSSLKGGDFAFSVNEYLNKKYKKQFVVVTKPTFTYQKEQHQYANVQVQVVSKRKSVFKLSAVRLLTDYYSRYMNSPQKKYLNYLMNNAMNNNTRKVTEKRLEVEMRVVGRPQLTTAANIYIDNIGSRSGNYHIKRVIHRLSSEGYTCSLTLSPAGYKTASHTDSVEVGLGTSKSTKRSPGGGKEQPVERGKVYLDYSLITQDELEYFNTKTNLNDQTNAAIEVAYNLFLRASNRPGAQKSGVYHKHVQMEGSKVSKVWYTSTPPVHGKDFGDFKTVYSSKFYDLLRKKAENFKRYHKNN